MPCTFVDGSPSHMIEHQRRVNVINELEDLVEIQVLIERDTRRIFLVLLFDAFHHLDALGFWQSSIQQQDLGKIPLRDLVVFRLVALELEQEREGNVRYSGL
jgi:hypothetical protein